MSFSSKVQDRSIRVSFYDNDGTRVDNVTKSQAKSIAERNPGKLFYFQDKDGFQRELTIDEVLALIPESDLVSNTVVGSGCPTAPQPCGPPKVQFFGGEGVGAMANAVISPVSSGVIAFDIVNPGKNYKEPPFAILDDECGKGSGSSLETILDGDKIQNILINSPGDGYLTNFDGSLGGNGRTWKESDEGYVITKDGGYYTVPDDRVPSNLQPGDTWNPPYNPPVIIPEDSGEGEIIIPPTVPEVPTEEVIITPVPGTGVPGSPLIPSPFTPVSPPTYKVILCLENVVIEDSGFNYRQGDSIKITPDKGSILDPIINFRGEVIGVKIISKGCGYDDLPEITMESETGFNATFRPILSVTRVLDESQEIPPDVKVVSVVDCVGIIPPKIEFDIVPR